MNHLQRWAFLLCCVFLASGVRAQSYTLGLNLRSDDFEDFNETEHIDGEVGEEFVFSADMVVAYPSSSRRRVASRKSWEGPSILESGTSIRIRCSLYGMQRSQSPSLATQDRLPRVWGRTQPLWKKL